MESDFRSSVFRLCKKLQSDPRTEAVRNTIHNLHVAAQTDNVTQMPKPGHGDLGYIARNQHLQFLGYLLTDEAVEKINQQQPFQATHLEKAERSLVEETVSCAPWISAWLQAEVGSNAVHLNISYGSFNRLVTPGKLLKIYFVVSQEFLFRVSVRKVLGV